MDRPVLIYDGDCGFCRYWVERWKHVTRDRVEYASSQTVAARFPGIHAEQFERSVVYVEPDGTVAMGAEAVFRALAHARRGTLWLAAYRGLPGFAAFAEAFYAAVARHRVLFSRVTRLVWGSEPRLPEHALVRWCVLRGVGLVYLTAFLSLWIQVDGLIGERGILPLAPWLDAVGRQLGQRAWSAAPTLFWLGAGDSALQLVCGAGTAAATSLVLNVLPGPAAVVAWVCYLSLFTAGRVFLSFQWDILLLEAGVITCLWAPWSFRPRRRTPSSRIPLWLLRWLVFRLMLLSGFVKLASGDPAWLDLTAMSYHYQTQPLPTWTSWYAHHLPLAVHRAETATMFVIELVLPFLILMPRQPRLVAFGGFVLLQVLISATGNYGFFNVLTAVLCIALLDDAHLEGWRRAFTRDRDTRTHASAPQRLATTAGTVVVRAWVACAGLLLVVLSAGNFVGRVGGYEHVPRTIRSLLAATDAFQLTSNYGLFAVMTKQRPEIVLEGSEDGATWTAYEFRWKPGDPVRRPRFVEPHMPRLDWQMWFAALGTYQRNPWLRALMQKLLERSPPVLALLASEPFEGRAPRYVRALVYDYRFSSFGDRAWWARNAPRIYAPVLERRGPGG